MGWSYFFGQAEGKAQETRTDIAAVSERNRRAFLARRVQALEAYVVWSLGSGLRPVAEGAGPGPVSRLIRRWGGRKFARDGDEVASVAAGTAETERQVERVVLRIHPSPEPPHGATADFDLVHLRGEQELRRERWSLSLRFEFLDSIPPELVVHNPMGLLVTYMRAARALVTGDER